MNQNQDQLSLDIVVQNAKTIMKKQTVLVNLDNQLLQYKQNVEKYKSHGEHTKNQQNQIELNKIGIEFNPQIQTEQELVTQIMRCHCYLPQVFLSQQQMQEFSAALDDSYIYDRRNMGTLIGMSIMGVIGFVALGFTIFGLLAGGVLGIMLGRYAGRRLRKQYQLSGQLSELDVYEIRVRCYLKWAQNKGIKYRYNINMLRFVVEKLMFEIKPALHYKQFKDTQTKQVKRLLNKVIDILKQPHFLNALILSLRLSEQYLRILKLLSENVHEASKLELEDIRIFQDFRGELEVCLLKAVDNVLKPMVGIFEETKLKNKNVIILIHSTKYFLLQTEIIQLAQQYPDPQMSLNFIRMMAEKMKQIVRPLNMGTYMKYQNFKDIEQIGIKLEEGQKQYDYQSVRKQIQVNDVIVELPDEQENEQENQFGDPEQNNLVVHQYEKQMSEIILVHDQDKLQNKDQNQEELKECIEIFSNSSVNNNQFNEPQLNINNNNNNNNNNSTTTNIPTTFKFAIKQHPNRAFMNKLISRPGDSDILGMVTPQRSLSKHDILQILEPEQSINQNQLQKLEKSLHLDQVQMPFSLETMQKFQLFLDYYNEPIDTWEEVMKKDEIFIYKAMKPGIGSVFIKGYAYIRGADKELVFNAVYIKPFRVKWDKIMQGFDIIKNESESIDIMYYYVSPPIPIVSTREWLQRRILRRDFPQKGQICLMFYSIDLPEKPQQKSRVRAHTEIAGYIFENTEEGAKISFISNNDVRGSIPKVLVNHASAKGPFGWFGNLRKACAQYKNVNGDLTKLNIK